MRTNRSRRIDRATAERLLDGRPVDPDSGRAALADLFASAAAPPPADGEQPGERAALAAFREARLGPVRQPRRTTMNASAALYTGRTGVKAALAALVVTALGGVALAAGTGHLPGAQQDAPRSGPAATRRAPSGSTGSGAASHGVSPGVRGASVPPSAAASAGPAGSELCRSWSAGSLGRAAARADPAFPGLVEAAGGQQHISAYCAAVLHGRPSGGPPTAPGGRSGHTPAATSDHGSHGADPSRPNRPAAKATRSTAKPGGRPG
ncbi:hypothetical protein [Peterkaempfera sp. SMS 1(5)a]|uniref:hypothetical protein n=1 Tax=Peterkaempfera podocarpi TaxID=3232308 RepID=UPI0036722289